MLHNSIQDKLIVFFPRLRRTDSKSVEEFENGLFMKCLLERCIYSLVIVVVVGCLKKSVNRKIYSFQIF